ncbi:PilZ domain-containing protein [Devosia sp.]|uniref:PilZ domain-containing protein n=1 Tax=Devosia sp. TaxID=1871048 RepID=UPI0035AFAB0A
MTPFEEGPSAPGRSDVRFVGALMGKYLLASRRDRAACVQVFACRLQSISPRQLVASAPVVGDLGEGMSASFEPFGLLRGRVERMIDGGFAVAIEAEPDDRALLAKRIAWYKRRTFNGLTDKRAHRRLMPRDPRSLLMLADGRALECLIIDMSRSGAAVSADIQPAIGTPLAIGTVVGRVVRWLDVGFAVRFVVEQDEMTLEDSLHPVPQLQLDC